MVPPGPNGQSTAGPGGSTAVPLTSPAYADSGAQTLPSQLTDVQLASTQQMTSGPAQGDNPYAPQQVGGPYTPQIIGGPYTQTNGGPYTPQVNESVPPAVPPYPVLYYSPDDTAEEQWYKDQFNAVSQAIYQQSVSAQQSGNAGIAASLAATASTTVIQPGAPLPTAPPATVLPQLPPPPLPQLPAAPDDPVAPISQLPPPQPDVVPPSATPAQPPPAQQAQPQVPQVPPTDQGPGLPGSTGSAARTAVVVTLQSVFSPVDFNGRPLSGPLHTWSDMKVGMPAARAAMAASNTGWMMESTTTHQLAEAREATLLARAAAAKFPGQTYTPAQLQGMSRSLMTVEEFRGIWDPSSASVVRGAALSLTPWEAHNINPGSVQARVEAPWLVGIGVLQGGAGIATGILSVMSGSRSDSPLAPVQVAGGAVEATGGALYAGGALANIVELPSAASAMSAGGMLMTTGGYVAMLASMVSTALEAAKIQSEALWGNPAAGQPPAVSPDMANAYTGFTLFSGM
jgi:hypothetical protein